MKSRLKYSLNLCLIATALVLVSCGKKENKVNSSISGSSPFYTGNSALNTSVGSTIINQVQSIKANVSCMNGYRLTNDVSFYVQGGIVASNKIGGNWQSGFLTNGTINKLWIGVSAYRDLMFVTQVVNGSQVVGFNVTLSFCELKNTYSTLPSIISNERALRNFAAPYGIVLDSNTYCGYSVVDLAMNTVITSERNLSNPYSPPNAQIPTSFTKPTCNGQF
ncbi:hypothetical protein DOM21_03575 [Bacteriovorax stolpii]|uniref:Uncharacterized protein n=1 Tax=Bacteriovorax stolpii TaxID=960 RepID=A0A2K9NVB5_BACTC|nr:hypothetical protein [Bacteriovorax stolpii]AUN99461.1 hypothetical protein C0V70_15365 [Bacteriovorax stolpii]QDK40546.1 hypothetical protein DOM21_03575 [Bacteriovorax stolpii]TDP54994.1 hypothetical protein C8D79_0036 [Bacteriovorax stolpii]BDT29632.1 lipoprotein [Bacteriovorax sp. HI3]